MSALDRHRKAYKQYTAALDSLAGLAELDEDVLFGAGLSPGTLKLDPQFSAASAGGAAGASAGATAGSRTPEQLATSSKPLTSEADIKAAYDYWHSDDDKVVARPEAPTPRVKEPGFFASLSTAQIALGGVGVVAIGFGLYAAFSGGGAPRRRYA